MAKPLKAFLDKLKPQLAKAAQEIYDNWDSEDPDCGGGGICDLVAGAMGDVITSKAENSPDISDGGHDGDDHAWIIVQSGDEAYGVDIPPHVYERGGGYSWTKVQGVRILPEHVVIFPIDTKWL